MYYELLLGHHVIPLIDRIMEGLPHLGTFELESLDNKENTFSLADIAARIKGFSNSKCLKGKNKTSNLSSKAWT